MFNTIRCDIFLASRSMKFSHCKYTICLIIQIILIFPFASMRRVREWQMTCPDSSQWNLRARGFCNITNPHYYCLYDVNVLHYKDFCRAKEDFHKPGNKYIIRGDIDGEPCKGNRFQPFKFTTDGNDECIFQKSICNEEGQIVQNNGTTAADTACRCDYTEGYVFVIEPTNKCFCHPTLEDCTCYKKKCDKNQFLNPNYKCGSHLLGDFDCPIIKTKRLKNNITIAAAVPIKPTLPPASVLDLSGFKVHIHTAKVVVLILVLSMLFVVFLFFIFGIRLIDKCRQFMMMEDTISKKVEEQIARYKRDLHTEKYQDAPDDLMETEEEELSRLKIKDIHNQHINDWIKEDEKFIVTIATHKICDRLEADSCVLVVGRAGNGKSSISRHIALRQKRLEQYEIIPIVPIPDSIFNFLNRKRKQIFIVDDLCGNMNIDAQSVDLWLSQIKEILKLINTSDKSGTKHIAEVKFIFATGLNIYNDNIFQKLKLLKKYVFSLSEWPLTNDEKKKMLKKYISPEVAPTLLETLNSDKAYFPLLCKISERKTADQIVWLFSNPNEFIRQELIAMKKSSNIKFCVITLCALLNNKFKEEILNEIYESDIERQAVENVCLEFNLGPNKDTVKSKIKEQLDNLENTYVTKTENYYHFIHSKVYNIAVLVCGQTFLHIFIKFVRSSCIAQRFSFQSKMTNNQDIIIINDENTEKRYFDRLMFDLEQGDTYSTFHNSQLRSESYRAKLCSYFRIRKQKMIELLQHFIEKSDTENLTFADRSYEDYIEFTKQHHFCSLKMRKPLIESAWEGYADIVQMLLDFDCDINEVDRFGRTALFVACLLGKKEVVNVLLERNADILLCDKHGQSPLLVASRERYDEIVNTLLNHGADVNQCDVKGNSPLFVASSESQLSTVQILSRKMPQISKRNNLGQTPVFVASMKGRKDVLSYLLSFLSLCISTTDNDGKSPLFIACMEGHHNVVELLLKHNADVSQSDWNKRSPLFIASAEGYADIVTTLIKHKADINQSDDEGMTPLLIACEKGRTEVAKILVNWEADLNVTDHKKRTPLYAACRRGFLDIVKLLHENNASISVCNKWGGTPLFAACRQGHSDIVKYLVEHGAILSIQDFNGTTPLLVASENGNTEIGKFLIGSGSDINQSDHYKKTPLHVSAAGGHDNIVQVLINAGANKNLTDIDNQTPLDLARKYSSNNIVNLLSSDE